MSVSPQPPVQEPSEEDARQGSSKAINLATEMVAATLIGYGMGYGLDHWLNTAPWCQAIFFLFGVIAGFLNAFRAANPEMFAQSRQQGLDKREK